MYQRFQKVLLLLALSVAFVSCQKGRIHKTGFLSKIKTGRSIASSSKIDAKQILIYCEMTSENSQECFYKNAKRLKLNTSLNTFHKTKKTLNEVSNKYLESIEPKFEKTVSQRVRFCNKNSLYNFKRCLKMNSIKHTMNILNEEHKKTKFNGQEYLYLKKKFLNTLDQKYEKQILARLTK